MVSLSSTFHAKTQNWSCLFAFDLSRNLYMILKSEVDRSLDCFSVFTCNINWIWLVKDFSCSVLLQASDSAFSYIRLLLAIARLSYRGHQRLHTLRRTGKRPTEANKDAPEQERDGGAQPDWTISGGARMASVMRGLHSAGLFRILLFCLLTFDYYDDVMPNLWLWCRDLFCIVLLSMR